MFALQCTMKLIRECKANYIFIDEISMMEEKFYKFIITLKKNRPDIIFILSGDFEQLEPVNDRCNFDYKNSLALFEIVDSNRLTLTKCRRANDELFEMLKPGNIEKITNHMWSLANISGSSVSSMRPYEKIRLTF